MSTDEQVEFLGHGCERVYSPTELSQKLQCARRDGRPLRIKLGMDPTAPDLTLGHTVVLGKMRDFQDLGHQAVLIIGDYTARIGDPTGRSKTRPILDENQVQTNAETYLAQAGKVLDLSPGKLEIRRNSEWLASMNFADVIRLAAQMTVARMLERDTFMKRHQAGVEIYLHEMFYPLMQAHDSVMVRADVELGGSDQTFNNLVGRDFQKNAGQEPQVVVIMPLLVGLDGVEKMSKSLGNYVGVTEAPADMFGKIMSIPDGLMRNYFELLTRRPAAEVDALLDTEKTHPRDAKAALGKDIVARFHSPAAGDAAADEFFRIHGTGQSGLPDDMPEMTVPASLNAVDLVVACGFAKTKSEARRLMAENGVRLDGQVLTEPSAVVQVRSGAVIQRGRRMFLRLFPSR